jgi:hypothetical protein
VQGCQPRAGLDEALTGWEQHRPNHSRAPEGLIDPDNELVDVDQDPVDDGQGFLDRVAPVEGCAWQIALQIIAARRMGF